MLRKAVDLGMPKEEADAILGRDIAKPQGKLPAWPTPTVGDSRNAANATANRTKEGHHSGTTLIDATRIWPTPTVAEGGKISCSPNFGQRGLSNHPEMVGEPEREKQAKTRSGEAGPHAQANPKPTGNRLGLLNATWVETLMGFPIGWTASELSGTR